jgi:hypothetical protein
MRTTLAALVLPLLLATSAGAQERARRAPLADVEDLEPAVDVSEPRVAIVPRPAAPAAVAQLPPAASTPAPAAAPLEARAAPSAPVSAQATPQAAERPAARAMDSLDLGTTSITGNAELPKVLYIVPWKKSDLGDLVGRPVNTLLDEVLAPVDPAVFERHLSYYDSLYGEREEE